MRISDPSTHRSPELIGRDVDQRRSEIDRYVLAEETWTALLNVVFRLVQVVWTSLGLRPRSCQVRRIAAGMPER